MVQDDLTTLNSAVSSIEYLGGREGGREGEREREREEGRERERKGERVGGRERAQEEERKNHYKLTKERTIIIIIDARQ